VLASHFVGATDTPVWFLFAATVALAIVTGTLAGAAIYALKQLGEVRRDRDVQVLADLGRRWDEDQLRAAREAAAHYDKDEFASEADKLFHTPPDTSAQKEFIVLLRIPNFFEDLAIITESGDMDLALVGRGFKGLILDEWHFWKPTIDRFRQNDPYAYSQFERLARDMERLPDE